MKSTQMLISVVSIMINCSWIFPRSSRHLMKAGEQVWYHNDCNYHINNQSGVYKIVLSQFRCVSRHYAQSCIITKVHQWSCQTSKILVQAILLVKVFPLLFQLAVQLASIMMRSRSHVRHVKWTHTRMWSVLMTARNVQSIQ